MGIYRPSSCHPDKLLFEKAPKALCLLVLVLAFMAKTATAPWRSACFANSEAMAAAFVACLLTWIVTRSGADERDTFVNP